MLKKLFCQDGSSKCGGRQKRESIRLLKRSDLLIEIRTKIGLFNLDFEFFAMQASLNTKNVSSVSLLFLLNEKIRKRMELKLDSKLKPIIRLMKILII